MSVSSSRRICPGINVAERILFLAISRLLWAFTVHELPTEPISWEEYEGTISCQQVAKKMILIPQTKSVPDVTMQSKHELRRPAGPMISILHLLPGYLSLR